MGVVGDVPGGPSSVAESGDERSSRAGWWDVDLGIADKRMPKNVIDLLARRGPSDRATLAKELGIGRSTLSRAVSSLLDAHLLIERDLPPSGRGRPRTHLAVDPRRGSAVGFEFGLRHVRGVLIDVSHEILEVREEPLPIDYPPREALSLLEDFLREFDDAAPGPVLGVGLAVPGPIDRRTGVLTRSSILPEWDGRRVAEEVSRRIGRPTFADNDSTLAAYGELLFGDERSLSSMVYLKLHSGIGGGLILNGKVYRGSTGSAAEFGHISYDPSGPLCRCGNRGCLEASAGIPSFVEAVAVGLGRNVTFAEVVKLAISGEPAVEKIVDMAARQTGRAAASLANIFDPDRIVVGGSLLRVGPRLMTVIREEYTASVLPIHRDLPIVESRHGRNCSSLGAAALVFATSFDELLARNQRL